MICDDGVHLQNPNLQWNQQQDGFSVMLITARQHHRQAPSFPRLFLWTGRGSDSESDGPPHRKMPDIRKDDMLARRTSVSEPRTAMPFNQYLPNKSNQSGYVPMPLRKKKNDKEEGARKSWSTATSPIGGDRPFRWVWLKAEATYFGCWAVLHNLQASVTNLNGMFHWLNGVLSNLSLYNSCVILTNCE